MIHESLLLQFDDSLMDLPLGGARCGSCLPSSATLHLSLWQPRVSMDAGEMDQHVHSF